MGRTIPSYRLDQTGKKENGEYLDDSIWWLKTFRLPTTKQFAERNRIDLSIRQELVQTIQKFEGKFL
jgi:hypothetical protein